MRSSPKTDGFTVVEIMVAMSLFAIVMSLTLTAYRFCFQNAMACSRQVGFTGDARLATQKIQRKVEMGTGLGVFTNALGVNIAMGGTHVASICFVNDDGNNNTLADNMLVYYPDVTTTNGRSVLCRCVSAIAGTPMFRINGTAPEAVSIAFHVGDTTNGVTTYLSKREGFQGVEMRMSASPRNIPTCYTEM